MLFGQLSVGEMSDRGIVCLGNCRWESVRRGLSVRVMFVGEMTSGNYPSEKYPSRNCSSGKFQFGELSVWGTVVTNLSVGGMSVGEMISGNYPSQKYPSKNCPSGKRPSTVSASIEKDPPKSLS